MKYILSREYSLRSYRDYKYRLAIKNTYQTRPLKKEVFDILLICDGKNEINPNPDQMNILQNFVNRGIVRKAEAGDELSQWQKDICHDNNYMPAINLQITGKCNFNCLHCFNAKDNERLQSELTLSQIINILDQAKECGVLGFTITGGEPMVHRDIEAVFDAIYERDMHVFDFNTNGILLSQRFLDHLKGLNARPLMKISFDGVGFHDWMRGHSGAEEKTISAIKLCIENGFDVKVQTQLNRRNQDCMIETMSAMESLGVDTMRIIRTTEASRWEENAGDACLTFVEYYDKCFELIKRYKSEKHSMKLVFWQFAQYDPSTGTVITRNDKCRGEYRDSHYICPTIRHMMAVGANGNLYPCMQVSGTFENHGITYGNLFETSMMDQLNGSKYFDTICFRSEKRRELNEKCMSCRYFDECQGGCPALGFLSSVGDFFGVDKSKCMFFENGYYNKLMELSSDYR